MIGGIERIAQNHPRGTWRGLVWICPSHPITHQVDPLLRAPACFFRATVSEAVLLSNYADNFKIVSIRILGECKIELSEHDRVGLRCPHQ